MQVSLLKSKIHRATITGGNISYEGSLTIALDLMKKCGLVPYERILVPGPCIGGTQLPRLFGWISGWRMNTPKRDGFMPNWA